jgi:hypothetical protein
MNLENVTEEIADLCLAIGTDKTEVERIIAAQTDPLRAMLLVAGASATMDFQLKWRLFGQLVDIAKKSP